jgi:hypothetical protein
MILEVIPPGKRSKFLHKIVHHASIEAGVIGPALRKMVDRQPSGTFMGALLMHLVQTIKNNGYANALYNICITNTIK